ncbi:MAG: UbiA family prenyltransferase [Hyphomicrobiaceae bacterium]
MVLSAKPPLVVDLDGTLSPADTLIEALISLLLRLPGEIAGVLKALLRGRSAMKAHMASLAIYGKALPLRADFLAYLEAEKAAGRELHLATAADQSVADAIAGRVGLFTSAIGSSDGVNLKGRRKMEALARKFPNGFSYAGNDRADLRIWSVAESMVFVNVDRATKGKAMRLGKPVERDFPREALPLKTWLRAIRIHQWSKNVLLFVPLLLAHKYDDVPSVLTVLAGFVALGCVASGTYLINDLSDLDADRMHKSKCNRPLASGAISAGAGFVTALILIVGGLASSVMIAQAFAVTVGAYICLTLAYSLHFKKVPMVDVFVLGMLYTLRILMGMMLIGAQPSPWLLSFSMFFFFSLSMAKRHVEIVRAGGGANLDEFIKGRGYKASDAPLSLSFGVASSVAAILILFLYIVNEAYPIALYREPQWLWCIGFLVFLWTLRIWLLSHRGELDDDPVAFALKDPSSLFIGLLVLAVFGLATV